jgi:hypothetical protein
VRRAACLEKCFLPVTNCTCLRNEFFRFAAVNNFGFDKRAIFSVDCGHLQTAVIVFGLK